MSNFVQYDNLKNRASHFWSLLPQFCDSDAPTPRVDVSDIVLQKPKAQQR